MKQELLKAFEIFCQEEFGVDILRMVHEFLESSQSDFGGWISVEDRLPDHDNNVLAILDGNTCIMSYFSITEDGETFKVWGYVYDGINGEAVYDNIYSPTHWMEIPKLIQEQS